MLKRDEETTEPGFRIFLGISARLTGFSEEELSGTGMLQTYYYTLMKESDQVTVQSFLTIARDILACEENSEKQITRHLFPRPQKKSKSHSPVPFDQMPYDGLANRIILLWYTGIWTTMNWKDKKSQPERTAMVSAEAYTEGLAWKVAGTHPAGARQPGYGSWEYEPL